MRATIGGAAPLAHGPQRDTIPEEEQVIFDGAAGFATHGYKRPFCAKCKGIFHTHWYCELE
eukprot:2982540-Lingulodinium_polyedra.AAC.1